LSSSEILRLILSKIDPKLVEGGVKPVDGGFQVLVGRWQQTGKDTEAIVTWLKSTFGPILQVAWEAYKAQYV
jgi:hypothetical protein